LNSKRAPLDGDTDALRLGVDALLPRALKNRRIIPSCGAGRRTFFGDDMENGQDQLGLFCGGGLYSLQRLVGAPQRFRRRGAQGNQWESPLGGSGVTIASGAVKQVAPIPGRRKAATAEATATACSTRTRPWAAPIPTIRHGRRRACRTGGEHFGRNQYQTDPSIRRLRGTQEARNADLQDQSAGVEPTGGVATAQKSSRTAPIRWIPPTICRNSRCLIEFDTTILHTGPSTSRIGARVKVLRARGRVRAREGHADKRKKSTRSTPGLSERRANAVMARPRAEQRHPRGERDGLGYGFDRPIALIDRSKHAERSRTDIYIRKGGAK
jgi:outer membrane protein OmpA-like peptidoglycan-associated protein